LPEVPQGYTVVGTAMKRVLARLFVIALVVQIGHVTPAHALGSLRAMTCCARGCDHGRSLSDAMRCCGVQVGDQLAIAEHATGPTPTLVVYARGAPSVVGEPLVMLCARPTPRRDRPPPVFVFVRSLRL
jgi:hypothetical protein